MIHNWLKKLCADDRATFTTVRDRCYERPCLFHVNGCDALSKKSARHISGGCWMKQYLTTKRNYVRERASGGAFPPLARQPSRLLPVPPVLCSLHFTSPSTLSKNYEEEDYRDPSPGPSGSSSRPNAAATIHQENTKTRNNGLLTQYKSKVTKKVEISPWSKSHVNGTLLLWKYGNNHYLQTTHSRLISSIKSQTYFPVHM